MSGDTPEQPLTDGAAEIRRRVLDAEPVAVDNAAGATGPAPKPKPRKRQRAEPRFRVVADGVEKRFERENKETSETVNEWRWICSSLRVLAQTRDPGGEDWGRLLEIRDPDGKVKEWAMPNALLAGYGAQLREKLLALGVVIAPAPQRGRR